MTTRAPTPPPTTAPPRLGIGVDLVAVDRLDRSLRRTPSLLDRVFTEHEVADATRADVPLRHVVAVRRLAARFAAKEAYRKASGSPLPWREVEVRSAADGAPQLWVRGRPASAQVSLAHDGGVAVAMVVTTDLIQQT